MREALGRNGMEVVDPKGEKFDPNFAEALSTVQVEGTEAGVVVEVMQKGYRFEGQLIRPAMGVVAGYGRSRAEDGRDERSGRRALQDPRRQEGRERGRDQEGVPQAGAPVPP